MVQPLDYFKETPSQTAGPYVHIGLIPLQAGFEIYQNNFSNILVGPDTKGECIIIEGCVFDGSQTALRDALLEIWQADSEGNYRGWCNSNASDMSFRGWGRGGSDFENGKYRFETIKPGAVTGRDGRKMAPHVNLWIVARGINIGLNTRMYFSDEAVANKIDPILNRIETEGRRKTLIAARDEHGGMPVYNFDIHLQGARETVFFDV